MKPATTQNTSDPETSLSLTTAILKAAGDELRAEILRILQQDAFGVLELSRIFAIRQPAMSHHLKILSKAGLVTFRREGTCFFYRRSFHENDGLDLLRQQIFSQLDQCPVANDTIRGIEAIHQERAESSQEFFRNNAERFRKQQDLIASYHQYGDSVIELIEQLYLPENSLALEVGPGEGDLLPELARRFQKIIALDNSAPMLDRAKALVAEQKLSNIEFLLGDISALNETIDANIITLNMVLHHLAQPAETLNAIADLLVEGGALIITELCPHDQDWAHSACGDLWLGFCPDELTMWASAAGLDESKNLFLSQRNGFRIQIRQFLKPVAP